MLRFLAEILTQAYYVGVSVGLWFRVFGAYQVKSVGLPVSVSLQAPTSTAAVSADPPLPDSPHETGPKTPQCRAPDPGGPALMQCQPSLTNAHARTSAAICRACDPPRRLSPARTRLRTSRLCGSVCSGRFTLCDVLPMPPPASSSSTRVPRRVNPICACTSGDTHYTRMPRACVRARVGETLASERCGVLSQPLMPRCDAPLAAWRGPFALSL